MLFVICTVVMLLHSAASDSECPDNWTVFHGSCYMFGHDALHFSVAEGYCRQHHNAHLVHVDDSYENDFIKDRLRDLKTHHWWMGLTDEEVEGRWKWYDTDTVVTFTGWDKSQPDPSEEDCAIFSSDFDFQWADVPCMFNAIPICELRKDIDIVG